MLVFLAGEYGRAYCSWPRLGSPADETFNYDHRCDPHLGATPMVDSSLRRSVAAKYHGRRCHCPGLFPRNNGGAMGRAVLRGTRRNFSFIASHGLGLLRLDDARLVRDLGALVADDRRALRMGGMDEIRVLCAGGVWDCDVLSPPESISNRNIFTSTRAATRGDRIRIS